MSIIKGTNQIVAGFGGTKRSIGEVYFSQSSLATDNPGALPGWTGEYYENGKTLFPDLYNFVKAHSELQVTKAQYDSAIAAYGECPKYVINENTAQTSLRLPKYANYIKMANSTEGITQKGAGLPNITANWNSAQYDGGWGTSEGAVYGVKNNSPEHNSSSSGMRAYFDASRSSAVYGASDTVQPAHTTLYPWVSAYTSAIPASVAQAAEFTGALAGKANTDLVNTTPAQSFINKSMAWGIPDYSAGVSVTYPYTAPTAGLFTAYIGNGADVITVNGVNTGLQFNSVNSASVMVAAGDVVSVSGNSAATCKFFPLKGALNV